MRHLVCLALALSPLALTSCEPARATSLAPLDVFNIPGVGPAYVDSFTVACTTSPTIIRPAGGGMISYTAQNPSTTIVGVGDSAIADPDIATRTSPVYCATNCPAQEFGGNARAEYCRADTGTVTIYVRALVSAASAP